MKSGGQVIEEMDVVSQKEVILKQIVEGFPAEIREEVHEHLYVEFGLCELKQRPKIYSKLVKELKDGRVYGGRWNKVVDFYEDF